MAESQIVVDSSQLDALGKRLRNVKQMYPQPLLRLFGEASRIGKEAAQDKAPEVASRSLLSEASPTMGRVFSTLPKPQALTLEVGRSRGAKLPPIDVVEQWMRLRGLAGSSYRIAAAISQRGLRGRFFMSWGRKKVREAIPDLAKRAGDEILEKVAAA